jgi:hypothetical protein
MKTPGSKGNSDMQILLNSICICIFLSGQLFAQEEDLKEIYKDVTRVINSALLTKSGSKELSGFISYNHSNTIYTYDAELYQQIIIFEPVFSYFIVDNISLGVDLSYRHQKTEYKPSGDLAKIEQTFVGPIAKMYFGDERVRPFVLTDYLFMIGDNFDGGVLDVGAGVFYHASGNFGFSLFGKYGTAWSSRDSIDRQSRVFIGIGINNFIL